MDVGEVKQKFEYQEDRRYHFECCNNYHPNTLWALSPHQNLFMLATMALNFHLILFFQALRPSLGLEIGPPWPTAGRMQQGRPGNSTTGTLSEQQLRMLLSSIQTVLPQAGRVRSRRGPQGFLGEVHGQERREVLPQVRQGIRGAVGGQGVSQLGDDGHCPPRRRKGRGTAARRPARGTAAGAQQVSLCGRGRGRGGMPFKSIIVCENLKLPSIF